MTQIQRRKLLMGTGAAAVAWLASRALAQGRLAPPRVVFLSISFEKVYKPILAEFRDALRTLGRIEGRDHTFDTRWAEERMQRIPGLISDVLALKPAVILTHGSQLVTALQKATRSVPIVFASVGDPVGQGFVQSFRRPGGNITGVAFNDEINKKLYELAKMVVPSATRIATLTNEDNPASKHHLEIVPMVSKALGFESIKLNSVNSDGIEPAFKGAVEARAHALVVSPMAPFIGLRSRIAELQFKYRLPTFHGVGEGADAGGLASYSFPMDESYRRSAAIVDQILKGVSVAEIPVEIPTKYEIAINLRTAKVLGIKIPQDVLLRANRAIE